MATLKSSLAPPAIALVLVISGACLAHADGRGDRTDAAVATTDTAGTSKTQNNEATRTAERLRHKDRAATAADTTGKVPAHTPEWTHPDTSDPGRAASGEKGGTADINIGIGEQASKAPDLDRSDQDDGPRP